MHAHAYTHTCIHARTCMHAWAADNSTPSSTKQILRPWKAGVQRTLPSEVEGRRLRVYICCRGTRSNRVRTTGCVDFQGTMTGLTNNWLPAGEHSVATPPLLRTGCPVEEMQRGGSRRERGENSSTIQGRTIWKRPLKCSKKNLQRSETAKGKK